MSTARSRVVSLPTRETRSPVRRVSNSRDGEVQHPCDQALATGQHDGLASALQQVVLVTADERRDDDQCDEDRHEVAEVVAVLHQGDEAG